MTSGSLSSAAEMLMRRASNTAPEIDNVGAPHLSPMASKDTEKVNDLLADVYKARRAVPAQHALAEAVTLHEHGLQPVSSQPQDQLRGLKTQGARSRGFKASKSSGTEIWIHAASESETLTSSGMPWFSTRMSRTPQNASRFHWPPLTFHDPRLPPR